MYSYLLDKNWKTDVSINTSIYNEFFIWNVNTAIEYQQQLGIIGRLGQKMNYAIGAYTLLQDVLSYNMKFALSYSNAYYPGIPNSNTLSALLAITK